MCLILCDIGTSKPGGLGLIWAVVPQKDRRFNLSSLYVESLNNFVELKIEYMRSKSVFNNPGCDSDRHSLSHLELLLYFTWWALCYTS